MKSLFRLLPLLLLYSCCRPCHNYPVYDVSEFVIDSHIIRQGKNAILELMGVDVEDIPEEAMCEYQDEIAEDDILNIIVFHPTRRDLMEAFNYINQVAGGFKVVNGKVDLPDIPPVEVVGLTLEEAKYKLQNCLKEEVKNVELFVNYKDRLSRKVEISGMAAVSTIPVDGKVRLYEILSKSHIPPAANLFMSYVVRDGSPLYVDLYKLVNEGDMTQNVVMKGGDKVHIANPNDATVMMMGEVSRPQAIMLPYGFMSLREAIVMCGGIPFTGNRNSIQIIRGNLVCPKIYTVGWEHILHLPNDSLLLIPGDTVYVSRTPITEWNIFINQLFPSFSGVQTIWGIYELTR